MLSIKDGMSDAAPRFTLDELAALAGLPRRTVRYYLQVGLLPRPDGVGRGPHYGPRHAEQLLAIRKWQDAGLSLERIRELLATDGETPAVPPRPRRRGTVEVRSHLTVDEGVELVLDPQRAGLSPEQVRALALGVAELIDRIRSQQE
jgi:DNA-binding transcriptional MerR regulator